MSEYYEDGSAVRIESCVCRQSLSDIQEFVTVVCHYNCKICDFSCVSIADIRSHVASHLHRSSDADRILFCSESRSNDGTVSDDTSVIQTPSCEIVSTVASREALVSESVGLVSKEFSTISQSGCDFLSSAVVTHSTDPSALQPLQNVVTGQTLQLFINNQEVQLNMPNCFSGDSTTQEVAALPASTQAGLCIESSRRSSSVKTVDLLKDLGSLSVMSGIGQTVKSNEHTTEMYACDSCGTVFDGVGIVDHMLQVHGIHLDSVDVSGSPIVIGVSNDQQTSSTSTRGMIITMPPNTMSIGTQAQLAKKPGRKRKAVADVTASATAEEQLIKHVASTEEKENAAAAAVKTLGIERLTTTDGENGRPKRRIQPPRALVEDYHILGLRQSKPRSGSTASAVPELPCNFTGCRATFRQQEAVDYHVKCHADDGLFCCPECRSSFVDWSFTLPHLWTVHGIDLYVHPSGRCKSRANHSANVEHGAVEHGQVQPFLCSVCGETFRKAYLRNQHEKSHRNCRLFFCRRARSELTAFRRCVCDVCKRSFADKKSLNKHVEIVHRKIKPFSCTKCGYITARKSMLQLHERIHTGEKPFKCDICPYSASDHNTLRRHRMRHTGQKPYRCAFCSYTAIQAAALKTHMRTKHPSPASSAATVAGATMVYSCQSCRYKTVNRQSWLDHVEDHRSIPPPPTSIDTTSNEQLFVIQEQQGGQLVLAPLVHVTQTVASNPNPSTSIGNPVADGISTATSAVEDSKSDTADQHGLRHILTAISEQQQSTAVQSTL